MRMAAQVGAHEGAFGDDLQASRSNIGQRIVDQAAADALPLEGRIDLGVNEDDGLG